MKKFAYFAAAIFLSASPLQARTSGQQNCLNGRYIYRLGLEVKAVDSPAEIKNRHIDEFDRLGAARQDIYCALGGDALAANRLARRHYQGFDTPPETRDITADKKAAIYWRFSAMRGNLHAMAMLSHLYYVGDGVARDLSKSYFWAYLAHKHGHRGLRGTFREIEHKIPAKSRFVIRRKAEKWTTSTPELKSMLEKLTEY